MTLYKNIAKSRDELRLRVKEYVDGNKVLNWFPELQTNRTYIGTLLSVLAEYILEILDRGEIPSQDAIYEFAKDELWNYTAVLNIGKQ